MTAGAILILDIGKSNSKLSLWDSEGQRLESRVRANAVARWKSHRALDTAGIESWLESEIQDIAQRVEVSAIVPVAHGAAAGLVRGERLVAPPLCYEDEPSDELNAAYEGLRDAFSATGSPRLPAGLNLGLQLYRLEREFPNVWRDDAQIVTFPQYWAWRLSGIAACEVTSLGCHSDLWRPFERRFSDLAKGRGWDKRFAPLRHAGAVLGPITPAWAKRAKLPESCAVLCGVHDSNAAFHGARTHTQFAGRDVTVVSTGTWFVAMRAPACDAGLDASELSDGRDTLINVDVDGKPVPSARFMGGREVEQLIGAEDSPLREIAFVRDVAPGAIDDVLAAGAMVLPNFAPGVGPFPRSVGRWIGQASSDVARRAAVGLYLGLVTDVLLSLIGSRDAILIEGRFADDTSFVRMLAALRPDCDIFVACPDDGLERGALRLANRAPASSHALSKVTPLAQDVSRYVDRWRRLAGDVEVPK